MWIGDAFAQAPGGGGAGSGLFELLLMMGALFAIMYFLMIRPQQKRVKAHQALVESARRGDRIVTSGGLIGTVTRVQEPPFIQIEIAEGVRVRIVREHIQQILNRDQGQEKTEKVTGKGKA